MDDLAPRVWRTILVLFWVLVAVSAFTVLTMLIPALHDTMPQAILWQAGALFVLGALLCVQTIRAPVKRSLRRVLLLTGGSAVGVVLCFVLHNVLYALGMMAGDGRLLGGRLLGGLLQALEVAFFLCAVIVLPAALIISATCVIVLLARARGTPHHPTTGGLKPAA